MRFVLTMLFPLSCMAQIVGIQGVSIQNASIPVTQSGSWSLSANQSVNVAQVAGGTTATVATGVQKVGIADSGGTAFLSAANALNSTGGGLQASQIVGQFDDSSPTSITENQFGNLRMSANRNLTITSITQTSATWANSISKNGTNDFSRQWDALNVGSGASTTVTVNWSGNETSACNVAEWTGLDTASIADGTNSNSGSTTSASTNSITTSNADDLILCAVGYNSTSAPSAQPGGFTTMTRVSNTISMQPNYQIVSVTGTYSCSWTLPAGTNDWAAVIAAYKCTSCGGGGAPTVRQLSALGVGFTLFRYFWWW